MTLGVVARIHWHALRLVLKRVPFFHKPDAPGALRDTMMNTSVHSTPASRRLPSQAPAAARTVFRMLENLAVGRLDVQWPDGQHSTFPAHRSEQHDDLRATICLENWRVFERTLKSGDIGFAESYIDGDWHTPNLTALLSLFIANRDHIEKSHLRLLVGLTAVSRQALDESQFAPRQRENIHAHYDLGNDFYRLWLDPSMNYSSAWFEGRTGEALSKHDLKVASKPRCFERWMRPACNAATVS